MQPLDDEAFKKKFCETLNTKGNHLITICGTNLEQLPILYNQIVTELVGIWHSVKPEEKEAAANTLKALLETSAETHFSSPSYILLMPLLLIMSTCVAIDHPMLISCVEEILRKLYSCYPVLDTIIKGFPAH